MIIRAKVLTSSSEDSFSRVKLQSPDIWEESYLVSSVGAIPLVKGDTVYVDITEGVENPIILGRAHDSSSEHSASFDGSLLFDSSNGSQWTVAYVKNDKLVIENSSGSKIEVTGDSITINGGQNKGLVNVESVRSLVEALMKDLLIAGSGSNLSQWMATDMATALEDKKVTH